MKKRIAKIIADIAWKTAVATAGAASGWNAYQPKEPTALKKLLKK